MPTTSAQPHERNLREGRLEEAGRVSDPCLENLSGRAPSVGVG